MSVFIQPPFWAFGAGRPRGPHAASVVVRPAVLIATSSIANPTILTTTTPHGFMSGDTVAIAGHSGSTPALDGSKVVTVLTPTTFSIPVNVTVAGTGGTVTLTVAVEPLTLQEAKDRAGFVWAPGDPREDMLRGFIAAARGVVEKRTGLSLLTQTRDVYFDALPMNRAGTVQLPANSLPLQSVLSVTSTDTSGVQNILDPSNYITDFATARIGLAPSGVWPTDLRSMQPWVIRIVAGWPDAAAFRAAAPMLFQAVGLLTAHYATLGRDVAIVDSVNEVPYGFEDLIEPYCLVTVP